MMVTATVMPMEKALQKSMPVTMEVPIRSMPRDQLGSRPWACRMGLTAVCMITPALDPTIPQNGARRPPKMIPRWRVTPMGAAGSRLPKYGVRSQKGIGMRVIFFPCRTSVRVGMPT